MVSATYLWSRVLFNIEEKHSEAMVVTWFDDIDVVDLRDNILYLYTPNAFRKNILDNQCAPYIQEALAAAGYPEITAQVLDDTGLAIYRRGGLSSSGIEGIKPEFTFDNFVVGSSNQFAQASAWAVATQLGTAYNPLLIVGESGLGKTHLLSAIANHVKAKEPEKRIVCVKSEKFTNDMIVAISEANTAAFRKTYRDVDLFLMDDIQFIAGKDSTQEEFFHTFNTLYESGKQIVLTSDRPLSEMSKLENRIKTRLEWGLIANIQAPDYETRCAIISNKAKNMELSLPTDVISYVAENVTFNVRQLEGTLNRIKAYRDLSSDYVINLTNVSRAIRDMYKTPQDIIPTPPLIIMEVASYYNISESVIRGTARDKKTAEARQIAMYLIRSLTTLSLADIAEEFGKDHTTVMHSVDKIDRALGSSEEVKTAVRELTTNINARCSE